MRNLILTGFMGTGKTTVGRLLAQRLGVPFLDTDRHVEERAGLSIPEIFARHGEEYFRSLEHDVLRCAVAGGGTVIATGGGALTRPENRALIDDRQRVICLTAAAEALQTRVSSQDRPLLRGEAGRLAQLLEERAPVYDVYPQVETTDLSPEEVAMRVLDLFLESPVTTLSVSRTMESAVYAAPGLLGDAWALLPSFQFGDILIITDTNVHTAGHVTPFQHPFKTDQRHLYVVPPGESHKTLGTVSAILEHCLTLGLDRTATIVGVGGGVVCDIAGMVASTYLRGVDLVLVPTSLLAQVDAAVGGKVGVDVGQAKNAAGAFYPARAILVDPDVLATLPLSEVVNGSAEIIKIALIASPDLAADLARIPDAPALLEHRSLLVDAASLKASIVRDDPYERHTRKLLNYGHTIGHAVEAASGFTLSHGQAIAIGMIAETRVAVERGWSTPEVLSHLTALVDRFGLPHIAPHLDPSAIVSLTAFDKKRAGRTQIWAVPIRVGEGHIINVDDGATRMAASYAVGTA